MNFLSVYYIFNQTIKIRKIAYSLCFLSFFVFYQVGFFIVASFPQGGYWEFLFPNYSKTLLFNLGKGIQALEALFIINLSIIIGDKISKKILKRKGSLRKGSLTLMKDHINENVEDIHLYIFLFCSFVFIFSFIVIVCRFYILQDLPIVNLLIKGGYAKTFTTLWGFQENYNFLFKSSIIRQFAQVLLPLVTLLSLSLNELKPCTLYKYTSFIFVFITTIILASFLKKTPLILWAVSLIFYAISFKTRIYVKNKKILFLGFFILLLGLFGMSYMHKTEIRFPLSPANIQHPAPKQKKLLKSELEKIPLNTISTENIVFNTKKSPKKMITDYLLMKQFYNYNKDRFDLIGPSSVFCATISRIFIVEMIWSYLLCENNEVREYYLQYGPIKSYFEKMRNLKKKTVYEEMYAVITGLEPGAITFGMFFEIYFCFGVFSPFLIMLIILILNKLDRLIFHNYNNIIWKPFIIMGMAIFLQMPMKGFITIFFTGGGLTYLFCLISFIGTKKLFQNASHAGFYRRPALSG